MAQQNTVGCVAFYACNLCHVITQAADLARDKGPMNPSPISMTYDVLALFGCLHHSTCNSANMLP